jgi:hypothetical protein
MGGCRPFKIQNYGLAKKFKILCFQLGSCGSLNVRDHRKTKRTFRINLVSDYHITSRVVPRMKEILSPASPASSSRRKKWSV